jgi:hypothetical protein
VKNRIQRAVVDFSSSSKGYHIGVCWCSDLGYDSLAFLALVELGPLPKGYHVGECCWVFALDFGRLVILQLLKIWNLSYKLATQLKLNFRIAVKMNFLC